MGSRNTEAVALEGFGEKLGKMSIEKDSASEQFMLSPFTNIENIADLMENRVGRMS